MPRRHASLRGAVHRRWLFLVLALGTAFVFWIGQDREASARGSLPWAGPAGGNISEGGTEVAKLPLDPLLKLHPVEDSIRAPILDSWEREWPIRDGYFAVLVEDDRGGPVPRYPVALARVDLEGKLTGVEPGSDIPTRANDDGFAFFPTSLIGQVPAEGGEYVITSDFVWEQDRRVALPQPGEHGGRLVLTVPAKGWVQLELIQSDGTAYPNPTEVYVCGEGVWRRYSGDSGQGVHWMHSLPFGEELRVVLSGDSFAAEMIDAGKLTRSRPTVSLVHEFHSSLLQIRGQAKFEDGVPHSHGELRLPVPKRQARRIRCDADGYFELALAKEATGPVTLTTARWGSQQDHRVSFELPPFQPKHMHPLGTVVFKADPFLVRGRVKTIPNSVPKPGVVIVAALNAAGEWAEIARQTARTGGAFCVLGKPMGTQFRVWFEPDGEGMGGFFRRGGESASAGKLGWIGTHDWPTAVYVGARASHLDLAVSPVAQVDGMVLGLKSEKGFVAWKTDQGLVRRARVYNSHFFLVCPPGPGTLQVQDESGKPIYWVRGHALVAGLAQVSELTTIQVP